MTSHSMPYEKTGILPVVNITQIEVALPLTKALLDGGIEALEVTLRSSCSLKAIRQIKERYPHMVIGCGTVLTIENAEDAIAAGADFIVSPGYDEELVDYCIERGIPITPGCTTASEIQSGLKKGLRVFKFFPAEQSGGLDTIKLLSGPFRDARFLPTGGITFNNLGRYLENESIIACGGSFMATASQLANGDYEGITAACKRAVNIGLGFELGHVGVNTENAESAHSLARAMGGIFGMSVKEGASSVFVDTAVEFMKFPYYGQKGHICFRTRSMARALAYFEKNNIPVIKESIRRDEKGNLVSAYLQEEIGGFAVHIVRK